MLNLFIKRKINPKNKKVIKAYGKDIIAEMYFDLLNFTENAKI